MNWVDLEGFEPSSNSLSWDTLRFLLVNVLMISQNIQFKAIFSHFEAFSSILWVANPLNTFKRLRIAF